MHILKPALNGPLSWLVFSLTSLTGRWPALVSLIFIVFTTIAWWKYYRQHKIYRSNFGEAMYYKHIRKQIESVVKKFKEPEESGISPSTDPSGNFSFTTFSVFGVLLYMTITEHIDKYDDDIEVIVYYFGFNSNLVEIISVGNKRHLKTDELLALLHRLKNPYIVS